jgi:hypothetical protein
MQLLASPRADGQQRVMMMHFLAEQLPIVQKLLDAIKEVWKWKSRLYSQGAVFDVTNFFPLLFTF